MCVCVCVCVCVCMCVHACVCQDKKTDKNPGGCCEKEKMITTKNSYSVQTAIL